MVTPADATARLWRSIEGDPTELERLTLTGADPVLPSIYPVGTLAVAAVGAATLAAAGLLRDRGGPGGGVRADLREAAIAFRSERHLRLNGGPVERLWAPLSGDYRCADGWVRLHCNFPHHEAAAVRALGLAGPDPEAAAQAVARRPRVEVAEAVLAEGGCAGASHEPAAWAAHPQGRALAGLPLVAITRLGGAGQPRLPAVGATSGRPLDGVRVLDLTRVIAGPVCGRVLAAHGARVLRVQSPQMLDQPTLILDTGFGKRFCQLNLRAPADRERFAALVSEADVVVQSYRPGALACLGFGPEGLARLRPGIVSVSLSAWGRTGPWQGRRGFDSVVQVVSGIALESARAAGQERPLHLPAQALDHGSGWLLALGAIEALRRRQRLGGSWQVQVSLARTGRWLDELGRVDGLGIPDLDQRAVADRLAEADSPFGRLTYVLPPGSIEGAPPRWDSPPHQPGGDPAEWW